MSLHPQPLLAVPEDTARVARAAFRRGNPYLLLRDRLGAVFADADFADLYPRRGQPAYTPWRLALVTLMQFREGLSDRQAADAVRGRIDWKYLLALDLDDAGFDFSVLCEFRARLLRHAAAERLLDRLLDAAREEGLLKPRGRSRTDSTHVLAAVRALNRLELLAETLRAALNVIAVVAPDWLREFAPPEWHERYDRRVEDTSPARHPCQARGLRRPGGCGRLLPARCPGWRGHARRTCGSCRRSLRCAASGRATSSGTSRARQTVAGVTDRPAACGCARSRGAAPVTVSRAPTRPRPASDPRPARTWTGYMVHLTETCDAERPRLIVHAEATPANVHEAMRTGAIHNALTTKGLTPSEHLVDAAYVSGNHIVAARERHGIELVGPPRPDLSWQARVDGAFRATDFTVNWESRRVHCPEERTSTTWGEYADNASGQRYVRAGFSPTDCRPCPSRPRCTRGPSRRLNLLPHPEHEAVAAARTRLKTEAGRDLYRQRRGVEGTISQGVRAFGLRRARYRGLAKTGLQSVVTAAAIDLDRLAALARRASSRPDPDLALRRADHDFANRVRGVMGTTTGGGADRICSGMEYPPLHRRLHLWVTILSI